MSKTVADALNRKPAHIITVSRETSVIEALSIMADKNIGSVVVMNNGKYEGIMTERDYSRKVILKGRSSTDTKVSEILSANLPWVTPEDLIDHCMQLMSEKNIRYLPVFNADELVGILSINDMVKETILSQEKTITELQDYFHSNV